VLKDHDLKRAVLVTILLVASLLGGLWFLAVRFKREPVPDNLLIVLIDALRADHLRCYGYKRDTSPLIDRLAARGLVFEDVTSQASQTKLSVASLFTSMRPSTHKVRKVDHYVKETRERILSSVLSPSFKTLAEVFSDAGFATGAWVANPHLRDFLGFSQGFSEYYYTDSTDGRELMERSLTWIEGIRPRRFFAYIHFMDVHYPYTPPPPFDQKFARQKGRVVYRNGYLPYVSPRDLRYTISQYDGEISHLDSTIKELLTRLDELGLAEDTLLVVTADHGDEFFEHHGMGHGFTVYQELLKVPLIIYWPRVLEPDRIRTPVRLIDLYPTLLEFFHLPLPYQLQGRSLMPLLGGNPLPAVPHYSESSNSIRSLRVGTHKIIEGFGPNSDRARAYALDEDPIELRPLRGKAPLGELQDRLVRLVAEDEARAREFGVGGEAELDDGTLKALRALGYVR